MASYGFANMITPFLCISGLRSSRRRLAATHPLGEVTQKIFAPAAHRLALAMVPRLEPDQGHRSSNSENFVTTEMIASYFSMNWLYSAVSSGLVEGACHE